MIHADGLPQFRFLSVDEPMRLAPALVRAAPVVAPIGIGAAVLMLPLGVPFAKRRRSNETGASAPAARLSKAGVS
jgi:hypothetical protein